MDRQNSRTRDALAKIMPATNDAVFADPLENISEQRRLASHKVRPAAKPMRAFEQFTADLQSCYSALRHLSTTLEAELKMDADKAMKRQEALEHLPDIVRPPEPNYSINDAVLMEGRTIGKVEFGFRHDIKGVHQSELILIYFTDGSIMGIDTGSLRRMRAADARASLRLVSTSPQRPRGSKSPSENGKRVRTV
jgi:hypothetical protein